VQFLAFGLVYLIWGDWSNDGFLPVKKKIGGWQGFC